MKRTQNGSIEKRRCRDLDGETAADGEENGNGR